jgi:CheY-like chemotaxis protein
MAVVVTAEDNTDLRRLLKRLFTRAGFAVWCASDGAAALELARTYRPDVVVIDLDMPRMTGLQLCEAIRADGGLADVPVAILSGSLAGAGLCGLWLKPFAAAELIDAVRTLAVGGPHGHHAASAVCPLAAGV